MTRSYFGSKYVYLNMFPDVESVDSWGPGEDSTDSEWGPGVVDSVAGAGVAEPRLGYTCAGAPAVFFILGTESATGLWHEWKPVHPLVRSPHDGPFALGAVLGRWQLMSDTECKRRYDSEFSAEMFRRARACSASLSEQMAGYLVYQVLDVIAFDNDYLITEEMSHNPYRVFEHLSGVLCHRVDVEGTISDQKPLRQWSGEWRHEAKFEQVCIAKFNMWLAREILMRNTQFMHCVVVGPRLNNARCFHSRPGRKALKRFKEGNRMVEQILHIRQRPYRILHGWANQLPCDLILDWLSATRYLSKESDHIECAKAYAKLFARAPAVANAEFLMENLEQVGEYVLRKARVRLDAMTLLWWQEWFGTILLEDINFVVYIDGSPQRRGLELYAASVDVIYTGPRADPVWIRRLLLPVLNLSRDNLDAISKTVALLWQLLLLFGANLFGPMLGRIRGILSDSGTERLPFSPIS